MLAYVTLHRHMLVCHSIVLCWRTLHYIVLCWYVIVLYYVGVRYTTSSYVAMRFIESSLIVSYGFFPGTMTQKPANPSQVPRKTDP